MASITSRSPVIGIIADDLTSAADGAGPFMTKGLGVVVHCADSKAVGGSTHDVVSIDCDSRSQDKEKAAQSVFRATGSISNVPLLYKTIDSTLRGHIKAEIWAAARASGRKSVVIAPAFPSAGRITRNGIQLVDEVPVAKTHYAHDPVHPARTSRIADLIPAGLRSVFILDAETQDELNTQVASFQNPEDTLWVGSPGLAIALAETQIGMSGDPRPFPSSRKSLVVVGSANKISRLQADRLQDSENLTVLCAPLKRVSSPEKVLQILVRGAAELISTGHYDTLIATGGETMAAMLRALKVSEFSLVGEFEPGFPLGVGTLPNGKPLTLGLKAGGFGSETTLLSAVDALRPSLD